MRTGVNRERLKSDPTNQKFNFPRLKGLRKSSPDVQKSSSVKSIFFKLISVVGMGLNNAEWCFSIGRVSNNHTYLKIS